MSNLSSRVQTVVAIASPRLLILQGCTQCFPWNAPHNKQVLLPKEKPRKKRDSNPPYAQHILVPLAQKQNMSPVHQEFSQECAILSNYWPMNASSRVRQRMAGLPSC
eukprot:1137785-Pelagomonas_calceolata.AAC.2